MTTDQIEPFWSRLPAIALYPFRGGALVSLLVLGVAMVLVGWMPIVVGLLWLIACKQAFDCLVSSANGWLTAPHVSPGIDNLLVWKYLLMQMLFVALPIVAAVTMEPALGLALSIAFAVVLPAAIMALAITGSLARAIDPELWMTLIFRVGWPYLALIGLLLVIQLSAANAGAILQQWLPEPVAAAGGVLFALWALFATFHLMGYLIYQFHQTLEFQPSRMASARSRDSALDPDEPLLEEAGLKLQSGDLAGALDLLRVEVRSRYVSLKVHDFYRQLLRQSGNSVEILSHGRQLLHQLLTEREDKRALELASDCLTLDPTFTAIDLEQNAALARRAEFGGQARLAIDLLLAAIRNPSPHVDKALWALHAADLLVRQHGREDEASALLRQARGDCSDQQLRERIDSQLALLP